MRFKSLSAVVAACALQACAAATDFFARSTADVPQTRCQAAGAQLVLGQAADARVVNEALQGAGALRSRVIRPGTAVTLEVDPLRLNLEVDDGGRIRRLRCG